MLPSNLEAAMCGPLRDLHVRPVEGSASPLGIVPSQPPTSPCCCRPVGRPSKPSPKKNWAALAWPSSIFPNNANYISNGNGWALVSGSHSPERFINIHQRGHWLVRAPTFKEAGLHRELQASLANYSCRSTLLLCARRVLSRQIFFAWPVLFSNKIEKKIKNRGLPTNLVPNYAGVLNP